MVFSSLIFIFGFLFLHFIVYILCRTTKSKNISLLIFSLIFYSWGGPQFLAVLIIMTFFNYVCAKSIQVNRGKIKAKLMLIFSCVISIGILGFFKYTNFLFENIKLLLKLPYEIPQIILPIGISFYTFQLISYVVDVYKGKAEAQQKFWKLLLYSSLFHQCIAGPIVRYSDIALEIENRSVNRKDVESGIGRFSIGLFKKVILANQCAEIADSMLAGDVANIQNIPAAGLWIGMLMFMLQIYLDFSAYSDMAIGMGKIIGFHYKENFNYPYMSRTVGEFWRRWHMSLGAFFRDYVYIPLGGNRKGKIRTIINMFVVWALTGFWHGASWNFVLWGLYFFVFISMERLFLNKVLSFMPKIISNIYLLIVVYFGWVLFKFTDMNVVAAILKGMFCFNGNALMDFKIKTIFMNNIYFIIVSIIAVTPLVKNIYNYLLNKKIKSVNYILYVAKSLLNPLLLIIAMIALIGNSYNPFLYFQF